MQDPECNYDLIYTWRYIDPSTETYSALPEAFAGEAKKMVIESDDVSLEGLQEIRLKGAVSMMFLIPEVFNETPIFIDFINPCRNTVLDADQSFSIDVLDVPLGESSAVYKFTAPTDSVSSRYGDGRDRCGYRDVSLRDEFGEFVELENLQFYSFRNMIEFNLQSYPS